MKKSLVALAIATTLFASPTMAEGQLYAFGEYGQSSFKNITPFKNPGVFELGAGYRFHPNVAAELGFSVFGDSVVDAGSGVTVTAAPRSTHAAAVGIYPINESVEIFGKMGFASNNVDITSTGLGGASDKVSNRGLYYGFGANYKLSPALSLRVQYQDFGKFDDVPPESTATSVSMGAMIYF